MRKNTNSAPRQIRCPRCQAPAGTLCTGKNGAMLIGGHIERQGAGRKAIRAALAYYAGLNLRQKAGR
jgi:hypothetical protein